MREDLLSWLAGDRPEKLPSKETLNHPELIKLASGLDPFLETPRAYRRAYESLGIDLINVAPEANAPAPLVPGQVNLRTDGVMEGYLGVFNTTARIRFPFKTTEEFWESKIADLEYSQLNLPGAQYMMECRRDAIERKMDFIGDAGLYYYQLYTTLFMWGVEALGWEIFMLSAAEDPDRFDRLFLSSVFEKSKTIVSMLSELDIPFVVCHDDIAVGSGPAFNPEWYKDHIFPRYEQLWRIPHDRGKKVIFVADGKLEWALEPLRRTGVDGVMFETPSTDLDAVMDVFGDRIFIGGIDVQLLTRAEPDEVRRHTLDVARRASDRHGFMLCCSGGLNGNIPMPNAEAYFDARVEAGFTRPDWRNPAS